VSLDDFKARLAKTAIPWQAARALSWFLGIYAVITGYDYMNTPNPVGRSLTVVERIASLQTWGIYFTVTGLMLLIGLATRRHLLVWLGHFVCGILYAGFTVATIQAVFEIMGSEAGRAQGSILRAIPAAVLPAALHGLLCAVRGFVPRKGTPL
jgi:hypothetical protein